jgi:hypothetical protein
MTDIDKTIEEAKADMLPYESWEQLAREGSSAFAAFCVCSLLRFPRLRP